MDRKTHEPLLLLGVQFGICDFARQSGAVFINGHTGVRWRCRVLYRPTRSYGFLDTHLKRSGSVTAEEEGENGRPQHSLAAAR
ncbi:MAG: hypothetical protein OXM56_13050 [Gammaproteobacteria bacterium]|nr:hypothetical protein [Gammaproteobacteria bacterium]